MSSKRHPERSHHQHHYQQRPHHPYRRTQGPRPRKEVIATNVQLLIEQLEAGHSEGLTAYLTAMGPFS